MGSLRGVKVTSGSVLVILMVLRQSFCISLFIFGRTESSLLGGFFSSCRELGLLLTSMRRLLIVVASRCKAWTLGKWASVVVAPGL